ncbi:MAG: ABC transporter permease [Bacilli bacterium]|jgi:NitT/TauT family transport system permease protein
MANFFKKNKKTLLTIAGVLALFLIWLILALTINSPILPSPKATFGRLFSLLGEGNTYLHIGYTLLRLLISLAFAILCGLILGILGGTFKGFYAFLNPLIVTLRTIPTASLILILISLTKIAYAPVIVSFILMFPLIYEATVNGLVNIDENIINALKIDGNRGLSSLFRVKLPLASSSINLGIIQSLGLGMKVTIMSEIISGSRNVYGLGFALRIAQEDVIYTDMWALTLIAIILIGIIELILYFVKRLLKN